ncbi:MAG: LCP family protein [Candidatus Eremiobacteraeota bacterium]|nr:LCP family protein [Candidatus Eremiobacteraeota bacterium]
MVSKQWLRAAGFAALAAVAAVAGFFIFRQPVQQQIAEHSAQTAFGQNQLNILLLGYQDDENTTDTIILAHLDVDRRTATLVSIPRDTWVPIPRDGHDKINAAYAFGGAKTTTAVVSKLLGGVPIDATVAIQPEGAAQIVDAMGGLNVNVDEDMDYDDNYGDLHIHLKKGEQYLTGSQVVGYMRFRHDAASDFGRVHRQQQVLKLLMAELSQPQNWAKLPRILQFARKDVKTSLGDQQLAALLEIYRNVPDDNIRSFTLPSKPGWVGDASVVFADQRWASLIGTLLFSKVQPPPDEVVVANATGNTEFDKTLIGALRGAGWNVPTFVDQPARASSFVTGGTLAAHSLSKTFAVSLKPAKATTLVIGADLAPDEE